MKTEQYKPLTLEQIRQQRLVRELFDGFNESDFKRDFIGEGDSYVLVPDDNPAQAEGAMAYAQDAKEYDGINILIIKASRDESGQYTRFAASPTPEVKES